MRIYTKLIMAALAMVLTGIAIPAYANLVPTTFGFPTSVTNASNSAFLQDHAIALDMENISIRFPPIFDSVVLGPSGFGGGARLPDGTQFGGGGNFNIVPVGPFINVSFPDIAQNVTQMQDITHTEFTQSNAVTETTYPFVDVG